MNMHVMLTTMSAVLALLWGAMAQGGDEHEQDFLTAASAFVWDGDQLGQLTIRVPLNHTNSAAFYFTPLLRQGDRLVATDKAGRVMPINYWVPMAMRPTSLKLAGDRWAIITDTRGGGAYVLQLLIVRGNLMAVSGKNAPISDVNGGARLIHGVIVPSRAETRRLIDLTYPSLVEHNGRLFIVVSATGLTNSEPPTVLIAAADTYDKDGNLSGRVIGQGFCPHVVKLGNEFVCAVRYADRHPDVKDPATPIRLYRSTDLENWKQMPSPDESFRFTRFDLATDGEAICLLGVGEENDTPVTKLLRFDAKAQVWTAKDAELSVPDAKTDVRLLPRSAQRAKMTAVVPDASGDLTVAELRAP